MACRVAVGKEAIRGAKSMEGVEARGESIAAIEVDERARFAGRVDIGKMRPFWEKVGRGVGKVVLVG